MKLVGVALDKRDAARLQHLVERRRQQRRMDQREIVGERADHRHQMQAGFFAVPERQVEAVDGNAVRGQQVGNLLNARLVGAHAAADGERRAVHPDAVAALHLSRRLDPAEDGHAEAAIGGLVQRRFGVAQRLAHGQDDGAMIRHQ